MSNFEGETMGEEEFIRKYSGHWWLKSDEERAKHAISITRHTLILRDDNYTRGFIDACKKIEEKFNQLMKEKGNEWFLSYLDF